MAADTMTLSSGTTVSVSAASPATYNVAGYGALTYTAVGEVESVGEFGGTATVTQFTPLGTGVVKKYKGSIDYGQMAMVVGRLLSDDGQEALKAGFDGANRYIEHSFKIVDSDGSIIYFTGMVASFSNQVNDANSVTKVSVNIDINNPVIYSFT